jgi:hypothetical protein
MARLKLQLEVIIEHGQRSYYDAMARRYFLDSAVPWIYTCRVCGRGDMKVAYGEEDTYHYACESCVELIEA